MPASALGTSRLSADLPKPSTPAAGVFQIIRWVFQFHQMGRRKKGYRRTGRTATVAEATGSAPSSGRAAAAVVCGLLLLAVVLVFGQSLRHEFINCDDPLYVYTTPQVTDGLSLDSVGWAFTTTRAGNWHPLTWLSLMVDGQLYGALPWGYHLTNLLLHAAAAILLFQVFWRMTGNLWPAAFLAALFAIHPLRVESVAWAAERKDVLSGCLFMLTLAAYLGYVRHRGSPVRYWAVVVTFGLGLMAKPALVTTPFVLLLLDYWPLGRFTSQRSSAAAGGADNRWGRWGATYRRIFLEKVPLILLAAASCVVTTLAQGSAVIGVETVAFGPRLANAIVSYVVYVRQFFLPFGLALLYPHPGDSLSLDDWQVMAALLVLLFVSALAALGRRRCPYLFVGWFWYLGMLVPMIGIVQVGVQGMADRYTYLPQIGLGIALVWGAGAMVRGRPWRRWLCGTASSSAIVVLIVCAWRQTSYWHDGETLWRHTLACTSKNAMAHNDLGARLADYGRLRKALAHFEAALALAPTYQDAKNNIRGTKALLKLEEDPDRWRAWFRQHPDDLVKLKASAWRLATASDPEARKGAAAVALAEQAKRLTDGKDAEALDVLAAAYAEVRRFPEAAQTEEQACAIAAAAGNDADVEAFRTRLKLYRAGLPYRDTSLTKK